MLGRHLPISTTIQTSFATAFAKCHDAYRKDASAPVPPWPPRAAAACQIELAEAFDTFRAEISNLARKAPEECRDVDLITLGHLPTNPFGSRWAEIQGIGALQSAYDHMLTVARDWPQMLATMGDAGCGTCATLSVPPCTDRACKLAAASGVSVDLAGVGFSSPLGGTMVLKLCEAARWLASAVGNVYVLGGPAKTFDPRSGRSGHIVVHDDACVRGADPVRRSADDQLHQLCRATTPTGCPTRPVRRSRAPAPVMCAWRRRPTSRPMARSTVEPASI